MAAHVLVSSRTSFQNSRYPKPFCFCTQNGNIYGKGENRRFTLRRGDRRSRKCATSRRSQSEEEEEEEELIGSILANPFLFSRAMLPHQQRKLSYCGYDRKAPDRCMGEERYRLVVLGSAKVGKTSLIRQYLYHEFSEKYKETIEDLHSRQFRIQGIPLPLDILDTNFNFPDMRRLAISTASAFLLVFSVDDVQTFKEMSDLWQEICDRRPDIALLPTVVVGNKCDLGSKKIFEATATAFTKRLSGDVRYLEVSAKNNLRVVDIFRQLLEISGFPRCKASGGRLEDLGEESKEGSPILRRHNTTRERPTNRQIFMHKEAFKENEVQAKESPPLNHQASHPLLSLSERILGHNDLKRNRSLRMKSPRREKDTIEKKSLDDTETKPLSRSGSLIRRTKHLSLKMRRHGDKQESPQVVDESDCRIQ